MKKNIRIGDLLVESNIITVEQLKEGLKYAQETGNKIGEALITLNFVKELDILLLLEKQLGSKYINVNEYSIDKQTTRLIPEEIARENKLMPINVSNGKLVILTNDPLNIVALENISLITGMDIEVVITDKSSIENTINKYYDGSDDAAKAVEEFAEENVNSIEIENVESDDVTNAPIVRLVNNIFSQAIKRKVSDIHIEPFSNRVRIRFRIDGRLTEHMTINTNTLAPIITRLKIISGMDISIRRKTQDGRIELLIDDKEIDMRISVIPTVYGEKCVIRILDRNSIVINKSEAGFTKKNMEMLETLLKVNNGMILVTGPTGSGKTTTLFTMLKELNKTTDNIVTIENPVEYRLDGINQVQVDDKSGLTFAKSLRAILRQDPDILMIGEIRDEETAEVAIRASITGHIVLSTLHTNDATSTIVRLIDMGIKPYLVSSSVAGVIAQRLVGRICESCSITTLTTEQDRINLKIEENIEVKKPIGCIKCGGTGYLGRIPIHEILIIDKEIKKMISSNTDEESVRKKAIENGTSTLFQECRNLVINKTTGIDELMRIAYIID